jgi:hypothetical protein
MGKIDDDKLFTVLIINSLGRDYAQLQSSIHGMTDEPNFTSTVALKQIETEASLGQRRAELAIGAFSGTLVFSGTRDSVGPTPTHKSSSTHEPVE